MGEFVDFFFDLLCEELLFGFFEYEHSLHVFDLFCV